MDVVIDRDANYSIFSEEFIQDMTLRGKLRPNINVNNDPGTDDLKTQNTAT